MRKVAQLAFTAASTPDTVAGEWFPLVAAAIDDWLRLKGQLDPPSGEVRYPDGRIARLSSERISSSIGDLATWTLSEPTLGGRFTTELGLAYSGGEISFGCVLSAGNPNNVLTPIAVETRSPQVVRRVSELNIPWHVGQRRLSTRPLMSRGIQGGRELVDALRSRERSLPIIGVSNRDGLPLHPLLTQSIARDVVGLALVTDLDDQASWELTRQLGREWSCFGGAIRLYWPLLNMEGDPRTHPLWTGQRLVENSPTSEDAADRIRAVLRRRLFATASFALESPAVFERIRRAALEEELRSRRQLAQDHADFQQLAGSYALANDDLRIELAREQAISKQLRRDLHALQIQFEWRDADELEPSTAAPLTRVEDALQRARRELAPFLTFGDDCNDGVTTVSPDAGPPEKIYQYLAGLADLVIARRDGPIGATMPQWLGHRNIVASGEAEITRNNRGEMNRRRWHDGREPRQFDLHLKPVEATSPDRCVRIYFDWDDATQKIVVGWLGRHP